MNIGDLIQVSGCFGKDKYIAGRTLREIEEIIGFHPGRLAQGMIVAAIFELPKIDQFELAAYSNVATHRHVTPTDLDIQRLKKAAMASWATIGGDRLVKVLPTTRHNSGMTNDDQYPPGDGVPQWIAKVPLRAKVAAIVTGYPTARYVAADVVRRY